MGCTHHCYEIKDGALVCAACGEASPRAEVLAGKIVRKEAANPPPESKSETAHEDKAIRKHADKQRRK